MEKFKTIENAHNAHSILGTCIKEDGNVFSYIYFTIEEAEYAISKLHGNFLFSIDPKNSKIIHYDLTNNETDKYQKKRLPLFKKRVWIKPILDNYSFRCEVIEFIFTYMLKLSFDKKACESNFLHSGLTSRIDIPKEKSSGNRYSFDDISSILSNSFNFGYIYMGEGQNQSKGMMVSLSGQTDALITEMRSRKIPCTEKVQYIQTQIKETILNDLDTPHWKEILNINNNQVGQKTRKKSTGFEAKVKRLFRSVGSGKGFTFKYLTISDNLNPHVDVQVSFVFKRNAKKPSREEVFAMIPDVLKNHVSEYDEKRILLSEKSQGAETVVGTADNETGIKPVELSENQLWKYYLRIPKEFREKFAEKEGFGLIPEGSILVDAEYPVKQVIVDILGEETTLKPEHMKIQLNIK